MSININVPTVPISWGELVDKITILGIKAEKIREAKALSNVKRELSALLEIYKKDGEVVLRTNVLEAELRKINESLWDVEDALRSKELREDFDAEFIALARSVYILNDQRALLKRKINLLLGSELVEEKSYKSISP